MPRGAPRNENTRQAVLRAALELTAERGYERCSIEAIAREAGTSKQTIYRWWPGKSAILHEAFENLAGGNLDHPDTGDLRADFTTQMTALAAFFSSPHFARPLRGLIGAAQSDPGIAQTLLRSLFGPRRERAIARLQTGLIRGELQRGFDPTLMVDALYGPLYYRLLITEGELTPEYVRELIAFTLGPHLAGVTTAG
jgi:AcrR family transcriptional regulator